jgi:hypothetical protein
VSRGVDNASSGSNLLNALADFTNNPSKYNTSANNRWLIHIEPGTYNVGTSAINMKPFVDIEGSGRDSTTVVGTGLHLFNTVDGVELRELTAGCQAAQCFAIVNDGAFSPLITNVDAFVDATTGFSAAIVSTGGSPKIQNVHVQVSGSNAPTGIDIEGGGPLIQDLTAVGTGNFVMGMQILNASPFVSHATVVLSASPSPSPARGVSFNASDTSSTNVPFFDDLFVQISETGPSPSPFPHVAVFGQSSVPNSGINIRNSVLNADFAAASVNNSGANPMEVITANTQLIGQTGFTSGSDMRCVGDYDQNFISLPDGDWLAGACR